MAGDDYDVDQIKTVRTGAEAKAVSHGLRVEIVKGAGAGKKGLLARRTSIVGRSDAAEFVLADPTVSSFHVELSASPHLGGAGVQVVDLASANGTLYAGARLERAVIPSGAMLNLGRTVLRVDVDVPFAAEASTLPVFGELRGASVAMRELFSLLERLARTELSLLVEGPTGTGKELIARAVHDASPRASGPFVVLDCTAIPASLAESTLFGHEKAAFTGATERRLGVFEAADKGTIFLDEIGELPLELQPKLLRVLERREVVRVGSTKPHPIDVRVLGATWRDLRAMINQEKFREDLYYRLAQARVTVPPLRERLDDVPLLVKHFLARLPRDLVCARSFSPEALEELLRREFAGNVRELKSTVERAAMTAAGDVVTPADLSFERLLCGHHPAPPTPPSLPPKSGVPGAELARFKEAKRTLIDEFERDYLQRLLARTGNNLSRASALAGVERHHLRDLFRKHGLRNDEG